LGGAMLAASSGITWQFVTGTQPYQTVMAVHESAWKTLESQVGQPLDLIIRRGDGGNTTIKNLYILYQVPSPGPKLVAFVVADKRWKWPYKLITRDYNLPRKTGERTALNTVPVEGQITVDQFEYRQTSLRDQQSRWKARDMIEDILEQLHDDGQAGGGQSAGFRIESWPIADIAEDQREFTVQNIQLRDSGDAALDRALAMVPGLNIWVDAEGETVVFDASDLSQAEAWREELPPATWDGEKPVMVDRKAIRPSKIVVHYQREVEILIEWDDDWNNTSSVPGRNRPFAENVLPTVDPKTTLTAYDPELNQRVPRRDVPPGIWVPVTEWLPIMDEQRTGPAEWNFDTVRRFWVEGSLENILGDPRADRNQRGNEALRVAALREHFRQTFRISRRIMERVDSLDPIRAAMLDPVTGTRAPACVWGEACYLPTVKGNIIAAMNPGSELGVYINVDYLLPSRQEGKNIIETSPAPAGIQIIDEDQGIFSVDWKASPYGTRDAWIPCLLTNDGGTPKEPTRDLSRQDQEPIGTGYKMETGVEGIMLSKRCRLKALMTITPAAPNNAKRFHREAVTPDEAADILNADPRISSGTGPEMHVFIAPGEITARFGLQNEQAAASTIERLLGLDNEDPNEAGIDGAELPGYVLANQRELRAHAVAVAAEILVGYSDALAGRVTTRLGNQNPKIVGNMGGAGIAIAAAPSGKVVAVHDFSAFRPPQSRFALLPDSARRLILRTL
jgi:hypothetical protein